MSKVVIFETLRRHFVSPAYLATAFGVGIVAAIIGALNPAGRQWHGFLAIVIVVMAAELIGPEFSTGTLQLVLSRPIRRSTYLVSRYIGVLLCIWIVVAFGLAGQAIGTMVAAPDNPEWGVMIEGAGTLGIAALLVCALMAFFGTFLRSYYNVAFYIVLQVVFALVLTTLQQIQPDMPGMIGRFARFLRAHPQITAFLSAILDNVFPDRPDTIQGPWLMLVVTNAAIVILLACLVFRRREVPYGAD